MTNSQKQQFFPLQLVLEVSITLLQSAKIVWQPHTEAKLGNRRQGEQQNPSQLTTED